MKYTVMGLMIIVAAVSTTSKALVSLFYGSGYVAAATPLAILIFGGALLAVFMLLSSVISASGRPGIGLRIALLALAISVVLNAVLVPRHMMVGAAVASSVAALVAAAVSAAYIWKKFEVLMSLAMFMRISMAALVTAGVSLVLPGAGALLLLKYLAICAIYLGLLIVFKVLSRDDWEFLRGFVTQS
jgi:O-antigen/teichoic acid export membrane protein